MSRIAYASLGRPGAFTPNNRFSRAPAPGQLDQAQADPAPTDPLADSYANGYRDGQAAALAQAEEAMQRERRERALIELAFARFDAESERQLRDRMLATVHALCEEAVLPLALDSEGLARRVEAAAAMLQRKHDQRIVHIHPEDLELVKASVPASLELVADGSVERGGLRVETDDGGVEDGPQQWRRALAEIFDSCTR